MTEPSGGHGRIVPSAAQSLAATAGLPSLTAFGVYMALEVLRAENAHPSALAFGFAGIVMTNGLALWMAKSAMAEAIRPAETSTDVVPRPSGTVAFLFTDIENSTALWERVPDDMRVALRRHDAILESLVRERRGMIFARAGDGFGAAFARPEDAVDAALAVRQALETEPWPASIPLRVRFGINCGEADERDSDYFGPPVNRAARVMALAEPGTVLVTDVVARALEPNDGIDLDYRGPQHLRGVGGVTHVYAADRRL